MSSLHFGILSTSSIAPRFISAVRAIDGGRIVAVSSRTEEKAAAFAQQWHIDRAYGSHMALLNDPDVNIVYISTVNSEHYRWAREALLHGKHVICEKPCTVSAQETRKLFALAREQKCFFMEAQKMLFLPALQAVRQRIENGDLGQVHMIELSHSFSAEYNGWMFEKELGGGPLLSSGIYAFELILWLFGRIKSIAAKGSFCDNGVENQYVITGETESGVLFSIHNSTQAVLPNKAGIYAQRGWIEIPEYWKARSAVFHGTQQEKVDFPCEHELAYEVQHVVDCMESGLLTSPVVTEELTIAGISAIEKVKELWEQERL